jgi:hypothetical protein
MNRASHSRRTVSADRQALLLSMTCRRSERTAALSTQPLLRACSLSEGRPDDPPDRYQCSDAGGDGRVHAKRRMPRDVAVLDREHTDRNRPNAEPGASAATVRRFMPSRAFVSTSFGSIARLQTVWFPKPNDPSPRGGHLRTQSDVTTAAPASLLAFLHVGCAVRDEVISEDNISGPDSCLASAACRPAAALSVSRARSGRYIGCRCGGEA